MFFDITCSQNTFMYSKILTFNFLRDSFIYSYCLATNGYRKNVCSSDVKDDAYPPFIFASNLRATFDNYFVS